MSFLEVFSVQTAVTNWVHWRRSRGHIWGFQTPLTKPAATPCRALEPLLTAACVGWFVDVILWQCKQLNINYKDSWLTDWGRLATLSSWKQSLQDNLKKACLRLSWVSNDRNRRFPWNEISVESTDFISKKKTFCFPSAETDVLFLIKIVLIDLIWATFTWQVEKNVLILNIKRQKWCLNCLKREREKKLLRVQIW